MFLLLLWRYRFLKVLNFLFWKCATCFLHLFLGNYYTSSIFSSYITSFFCLVASVVSNSLWPRGLLPTRLLCPWNSPGENTGVGCYALLQGMFPTRGPNCVLPFSCIAGGFFTAGPPGMEKAMSAHSGTLPGNSRGRRSLVGVRHSWATSLSLPFHALEKAVATHSSVPAWRSPGIAQSGVAQSRTRRKRLSRAEPPGKHCCSFSDGCSVFLHVLQLCGFPYALSMVFYPTCYNSLFIRTSYKLVGYLRLLFISSSWELKHLWRLSVIVNIILQMIQA